MSDTGAAQPLYRSAGSFAMSRLAKFGSGWSY